MGREEINVDYEELLMMLMILMMKMKELAMTMGAVNVNND